MKNKLTISVKTTGRTGYIALCGMNIKDERWMCDAILDAFLVDDATLQTSDNSIRLENYHDSIDMENLMDGILLLVEELGISDYVLTQE